MPLVSNEVSHPSRYPSAPPLPLVPLPLPLPLPLGPLLATALVAAPEPVQHRTRERLVPSMPSRVSRTHR